MTNKNSKFVLAIIFSLMLSIGQIFAQSQGSTGTITGSVLDANGAVIPNANVSLNSKATGLSKTTTTNSDGVYQFVLLQPGTYTVKASASSFADQTLEVTVLVGRTIDANFTLGVQSSTNIVDVTGEGVQTQSSNFDAVQNDQAISNLPINGRRFQDFATLTPGAQVSLESGGTRGQISLSGQRGINGNINVDGVDFSQPFFGGIRGGERSNQSFSIPQESIREFQVVSAGYSAEFGRSSGGIINAVTKTGTNEVRGTAFYLFRPEKLARANAFAKALADQRLNALGIDATLAPNQHQFGGSVGGPIAKDKLFFFGSYEQQVFKAPRAILFGNLIGFAPTTGQTEAFNFYKNLESKYDQTNDAQAALGRIDWQINDSNRWNARYNFSNNKALNAVSTGETALDPTTTNSLSTNGTERNRNHGIVSQWISNFSPNVFNEFRFQFAHERRPRDPNAIVANVASSIGTYGTRNFLPTTQFDRRIQFADSLTIISGNHSFKFGGEFSHIHADQTFGFNQTGVYTFAGLTATAGILDAMSTVQTATFRGRFDTTTARYNQQIGNLAAAYSVKEISAFAQDAWRITPRFTLNYGIRYERQINPEAETGNNAVLNLIQNTAFPILGNRGINPASIPDSQHQWAPRLGFAWDPKGDGKTVIRGFGGVYYARTPLLTLAGPFNNFRVPAGDLSVTLGSPAFSSTGFNQATFDAANPQYTAIVGGTGFAPNTVFRQFAILGINLNTISLGNLPTLTPTQMQTIADKIAAATTGAPASLGVFQNANFTGIMPEFKNPQSYQFGGGVEREIMQGISIGLDYSQVATMYLQRNRDINLPNPINSNDYANLLISGNSATVQAGSVFQSMINDLRLANRLFVPLNTPGGLPTCAVPLVNNACPSGNTISFIRFAKPLTNIGQIQLRDSSARSLYRAITFRTNIVRKWGRLNAFYTLSKSLSNDDNERDAGGVLYSNPYNLTGEYYSANLDRRHQFTANPVFYLPFGFEVSSAIRLRSGRPFNALVGNDTNGDGITSDRPMLVASIELPRNYFTNRAMFDVDMRVQKGFKFGESRRLTFSAEFFNILNRSNLQFGGSATTNYCASSNTRCGLDGITNINFANIIQQNPTASNFGKLNIAGLNPGSQVFQMQLGARLQF